LDFNKEIFISRMHGANIFKKKEIEKLINLK